MRQGLRAMRGNAVLAWLMMRGWRRGNSQSVIRGIPGLLRVSGLNAISEVEMQAEQI
jgi:hypothetical protein